MPALPLDQAGKYVAAAYVVFLVLLVVYVAIMAAKLQRMQRQLGELGQLVERDGVEAEAGEASPSTQADADLIAAAPPHAGGAGSAREGGGD